MIQPAAFLQHLAGHGISFYAGVPDSLLKGLLACIEKKESRNHFIAANEGAALGLAAGYHLATGGLPVVYLQNSGMGNLVNPLTSLTDAEMYQIPILFIIGWRGEPGIPDEPQHAVMGKITPAMLNLLNIPFIVLKKDNDPQWKNLVNEAVVLCSSRNRAVALLVEAGVFADDDLEINGGHELSSENAIQLVYNSLHADDAVVCTTGKIGRAFYKINAVEKKIKACFLNVGSMGHAASIATGIALHRKNRVVLFDGDGALLMHTGALALTASLRLKNLVYVLLNNGAHQSVGSQPTLGFSVDFCTIAKGFGF
ncbi:MAG TPA: phosphonopyruvate decarboxylase, partial [Flavisolibacter sp.]|nr:phosphonopyruvate decarboxylase [Flavisolibacter sp.]